MRHRIKKNIPKVRSTNREEDVLCVVHHLRISGNEYVNTYEARYNCRGREVEVFTAKTDEDAVKHFLAVSEGDIPPMPTVERWDVMHSAVDETDKNTMDIFGN